MAIRKTPFHLFPIEDRALEACSYVNAVCTITEWAKQAESFFIRNARERSSLRFSPDDGWILNNVYDIYSWVS